MVVVVITAAIGPPYSHTAIFR